MSQQRPSSNPPTSLSLFNLLRSELGDSLPVVTYTKATLVHLSHTLEDIVLQEKLPALIFTGFQESSHWRKETERYLALSEVAKQICIFAGDALPPESNSTSLHIRLEGDDPLRQEWFLAVLSPRFAAVLCGQDNHRPTSVEGLREFNTIWSFQPEVVTLVLDVLEEAIAAYRPDRLPALQQSRRDYPPITPDADIVTRFTLEMLRFEEKLRQRIHRQEALLREVVNTITHQIYVRRFDHHGTPHTLYASPNMDQLTGYPTEQFLDDGNFWTNLVHPDDLPGARDHYTALHQGKDSSAVYRVLHQNGRWVWIEDTARVRDEATGERLIYGVLQDITEQRAAEDARRLDETLRIALEKERELNAVKSRFMRTISHEFRNPLATIHSASQVLENYHHRLDDAQRTDRLRTIQAQVHHLNEMLDDIAAIVRGDAGKIQFAPMPVDLDALVREVRHELEIANNHSHAIAYRYDGPDGPVEADPKLLRQIVVNLLGNAIKYSPAGSNIALSLTVTPAAIVLRVQDRGIGILPEDRARIFEPFYRGLNAGTTNGSGLGLKIVKDCAEQHGGSIHFESEPGRGTAFTVRLPLRAANDDPDDLHYMM